MTHVTNKETKTQATEVVDVTAVKGKSLGFYGQHSQARLSQTGLLLNSSSAVESLFVPQFPFFVLEQGHEDE